MSLYGLLGRTLKHSFSKKYFTNKFNQEGISSRYELFELAEIEELTSLLENHDDLAGLNVTIPYKELVIPFLDTLSEAAAEIGAVNTILPTPEGLKGYNTDAPGFEKSLRESWTGDLPEGALILGSGGASKAVKYVLGSRLNISTVLKVSRTPEGRDQCSYAALESLDWTKFRLVVNTTPLGTYPNVDQKPTLPYHLFSPRHLAFDLVYNPAETAFLAAAKAQGAKIVNGYDMLVNQAEASWKIWNEG